MNRRLDWLCATAVCCVAAMDASAAFVSMTREVQTVMIGGQPAVVSRHYAVFNYPDDRMIGVTNAVISPFGGTSFYQHSLGSATEPLGLFIGLDPTLAFDTFVTIGLTQFEHGQPHTSLEPGSGFSGPGGAFHGGWFVDPDAPQALVEQVDGLPYYRKLIGQVTFRGSDPFVAVAGEFTIRWLAPDGEEHQAAGSICGNVLSGLDNCAVGIGDINLDGRVNGIDLAIVLGSWGPCPRGSDCPADLGGTPAVDGWEILVILWRWAPDLHCGRD